MDTAAELGCDRSLVSIDPPGCGSDARGCLRFRSHALTVAAQVEGLAFPLAVFLPYRQTAFLTTRSAPAAFTSPQSR